MTNRRKFLVQTGMAATAIFASRPFNSMAKASDAFSLSNNSVLLLHSSNLLNEGGYELLRQTISESKAGFQNLVLLDTGSNAAKDPAHAGKMIGLLQDLNYDAALPGRVHFENQVSTRKIPLLATASGLNSDHPDNNIRPFHIIKKGDFKIGIMGAMAKSSGTIDDLAAVATRLKTAEGCHLVVCLSSLGYQDKNGIDDINLAAQSRNIDAIIGTSGTKSHRPEILVNADKHEVLVNHTSSDGVMIGKIEFGFDKDMKRNRISFANLRMENHSPKWSKFRV